MMDQAKWVLDQAKRVMDQAKRVLNKANKGVGIKDKIISGQDKDKIQNKGQDKDKINTCKKALAPQSFTNHHMWPSSHTPPPTNLGYIVNIYITASPFDLWSIAKTAGLLP